jgi:hypothetical protein
MRIHVFPSPGALLRSLLLTAAATSLLFFGCVSSRAQDDPPAQAGRISIVSGTVSIQPAGADDWNQAELNWPVGPGDRIFTDNDGRAEIQLGQTFFRIGPNSDVTLTEDTASSIAIGLAQGAVHIRCQGLWSGQSLHVDTPSGSASLDQPGEIRVDVFPGEDASIFTALASQAAVTGAGNYFQQIYAGQALELAGSNPVYPQWLEPAAADSLDLWSTRRDLQIGRASSFRYVSPEIAGADELDLYGTWRPVSEYGPIWFPNNMPAGWAPYHNGRWVNHDPWGWVWVEEEPWGYAPFHYGRWVNYGGRWGWIPGPVNDHPVWSPALVAFAGGVKVGGFGLSVWFPLGPGEPYHPWYHSSQRYIDQINISNIRESQRVHVQKTYVNINVTNITYVNRTIGVSAMRENDFAAGRPVHNSSVQIDAHAVDRPQILESPRVQPNPRQMVSNRPTRAVPVQARRPSLINEKGMMVEAKPNAQPVAVPMKTAPVVKTLPGRKVVAPPPAAGGAAGRTNGAQPASGGTAGEPTNKPGALPARTIQPGAGQPQGPNANPATNQPGARQPQGPNANPASGPAANPNATPAANPASGPTGRRGNQPPSTPAAGAGAQPASGGPTAQPTNKPGALPANVPSPQSTTQPGTRQPQGPNTNPASGPNSGRGNQPPSTPAAGAGAQPASGGSTAAPTNKPGAVPANVPSPQSTTQPGTRQPQGPNTNPASGPAANPTGNPAGNPASGPNSGRGNQPPSTPATGAGAQPASGTRPSQGTEVRPNAGPAANSSTQPNAKPSPQANKQGNQKQGDEKQKQDEKKKEEQEKQ